MVRSVSVRPGRERFGRVVLHPYPQVVYTSHHAPAVSASLRARCDYIPTQRRLVARRLQLSLCPSSQPSSAGFPSASLSGALRQPSQIRLQPSSQDPDLPLDLLLPDLNLPSLTPERGQGGRGCGGFWKAIWRVRSDDLRAERGVSAMSIYASVSPSPRHRTPSSWKQTCG